MEIRDGVEIRERAWTKEAEAGHDADEAESIYTSEWRPLTQPHSPVPRSIMMCLLRKKNMTVQGSYNSYIVLKSCRWWNGGGKSGT